MRNTPYRGRIERHHTNEDSDKYQRYNDIEDEGYVRGGYGRTYGRGEVETDYKFDDRTIAKDYDPDAESYHDEDVRGRHDRH
ncbi:hypothetical protein [Pseudobdellovibrio sp. HCB154]|uniref:hypothetical protein n=1 Tax=Pseudobdellovibrio sp. HCB154 TaxID=3386277 RepID=UPI0039171CBB